MRILLPASAFFRDDQTSEILNFTFFPHSWDDDTGGVLIIDTLPLALFYQNATTLHLREIYIIDTLEQD